MNRLIGRYIGEQPGPLLILIGAMHGNEPAGVEAIKMLFRELAIEPYHNSDFAFRGAVLGLIGNMEAFSKEKRYIDQDLNRSWDRELVNDILKGSRHYFSEMKEIYGILDVIKSHIEEFTPSEIIVLDLHTTSSKGGIFTIASEDDYSIKLAKNLFAPVVRGMLNGIQGSSIHFFNGENMGIKTTALAFEAGQHLDVLSPSRAYAAIVNCLRSIGCVCEHDVENRHDKILQFFSQNVPAVSTLVYKYKIKNYGHFEMAPGFVSFDIITKGQLLGKDGEVEILAPLDGRILMPLYQSQGADGFFIVQDAIG